MLAIITGAILGGLGNRYAGWDQGNRYLPAAGFWILLYMCYGFEATVFALAYLFWRSIGWYQSIDMGRNEGTWLRDAATMVLITFLPALTVMTMYPKPWLFAWLLAVPVLAYTAVMRGLPWEPKYKHIAVAEILSGALLGATAVFVVS